MAKVQTKFSCTACGATEAKWSGRCPRCGEWNTFVEEVVRDSKASSGKGGARRTSAVGERPTPLPEIEMTDTERIPTGYVECDRVLGGGIVPGSLVLLGGDPGIGKSTLLLQVSGHIAKGGDKVLYVSGEESKAQLKLRAGRLGIETPDLSVMADGDLEHILHQATEMHPALIVIDSIQTMYLPEVESAPGSVTQVRECTAKLLRHAKERNVSVVIIGHVTKDGNIAGPRMLEHMVDVVLYVEGERSYRFRIMRAIKNRFGSTSETGLFSMESEGLSELINPSAALLSEWSDEESGSAVMAYLEGIRPVLVEVQSLVTPTVFGMPRRTSIGYDQNRLVVLLAVLEKRSGIVLGNKDVYVNVIGGLKINEPACDLAMATAIVSNLKDCPVPGDTVIMGEVGLTGNVRSIPRVEQRIFEAAKLGFKHFVVPKSNADNLTAEARRQLAKDPSLRVTGVANLRQALSAVFS